GHVRTATMVAARAAVGMTGRTNKVPAVAISRRREAPVGEMPGEEVRVSSAIIILCCYGPSGWPAARRRHIRGECRDREGEAACPLVPAIRSKRSHFPAKYLEIRHPPIHSNC